jgi:SAM-dependent methyltransferase
VIARILSPLTGSIDVSWVGSIPTAPLAHDWWVLYHVDITPAFQGLSEIQIYRCDQTGLIFFRPVELAGSAEVYRSLQQTIGVYDDQLKWEHYTALRAVGGTRTLLEVGCGGGSFLAAVRERGIDGEGIDLNPEAVARARAKGLPASVIDLSNIAQASPSRYDTVVAFQTLEHVPEPGQFIAECLRVLKPGGTLIFSTPNNDGFLKHYRDVLDLPPHHMSQWTARTFRSLERLYPVRLKACLREPLARGHVPIYVSTYAERLRAPFGRLLVNRFSRAAVLNALNLGARHFVTGHTIYVQFRKI